MRNDRAAAFRNGFVEARLGSVESRLLGPVPRQLLDSALNPHVVRTAQALDAGRDVPVYDPVRGTFLTGALPKVKRILKQAGCRFRMKDLRSGSRRRSPWRLTGFELRDYQKDVVARALEKGRGLIDIGTGGGKTLLAAAILAELGPPALYLVTTRTLLAQAARSLRSMLGVEPGIVGDGVRTPGPLTVGLIQSLDPRLVDLNTWRGGTLIFDEGHHAAAGTWLSTIRRIAPRHHFYLSAVPFRSGGDQVVLDALAGAPLTGGRYSARFLIDRGYACPVLVRVERIRIRGEMAEKPFDRLYREFLVKNEARNRVVLRIAGEEARRGASVLVLVEHIRHGKALLSGMPGGSRFVCGNTPRGELAEVTDAYRRGEVRCLVATCGVFQEGVSIDGIQVLVHAGGLKSRAKVIQTVGRGMRTAPGKRFCTYVDFWDDDPSGVFRRHSRERLRVLKEEGFHVPSMAGPAAGRVEPEPVPPLWAHVADTKRFALVDGDGRVRGRAVCLRKDRVPERFCEGCRDTALCERGGRIEWQEDLD